MNQLYKIYSGYLTVKIRAIIVCIFDACKFTSVCHGFVSCIVSYLNECRVFNIEWCPNRHSFQIEDIQCKL